MMALLHRSANYNKERPPLSAQIEDRIFGGTAYQKGVKCFLGAIPFSVFQPNTAIVEVGQYSNGSEVVAFSPDSPCNISQSTSNITTPQLNLTV